MLKQHIKQLMHLKNLDRYMCVDALHDILDQNSNPFQVAVFLALLHAKKETPEEIFEFTAYLRQRMIPVKTPHIVLDIVGTGGDNANTVNISTGSAILAASCGVKIAKHGNRAVSSRAGSADVLEALGVKIDLSPEKVSASIEKIGIGFCYSPSFHPIMQSLRILRKSLNIPTIFNLLGPLLNPASPQHYLMGVYDKSLINIMADTLRKLGVKKSYIVHGKGLDEISSYGRTCVLEVTKEGINQVIIDPKDYGMSYCKLSDLQGGDAKVNAKLLLGAFSSENSHQIKAISDTLVLNAGVALYIYGIHDCLKDAINHARENLHSKKALNLLNQWVEFSHA